jgi:hypothetical protein
MQAMAEAGSGCRRSLLLRHETVGIELPTAGATSNSDQVQKYPLPQKKQ